MKRINSSLEYTVTSFSQICDEYLLRLLVDENLTVA